MTTGEGGFVWYQLVTPDVAAAAAFYSNVVGWNMVEAGRSGMNYTLARVEQRQVAGLTDFPLETAGVQGGWMGYILVADVDAMVDRVVKTGGSTRGAANDVSGIGRVAIVADPQGAAFTLFQADGERAPELAAITPGAIGWHELHTTDWDAAFAFYRELFGWEKSYANDMGPMGIYQTFSISGDWVGGMMNNHTPSPPAWLFYVTVEEIDAAAARVVGAGGTLLSGPHQVLGGNWVLMCKDPYGADFALAGTRTE